MLTLADAPLPAPVVSAPPRLRLGETGRIEIGWTAPSPAASLILDECGMDIADVCAGFPRFNRRDVRHGALAAVGDMSLKPQVHAALIKVYGCPAADAGDAELPIPSHTDLTDG